MTIITYLLLGVKKFDLNNLQYLNIEKVMKQVKSYSWIWRSWLAIDVAEDLDGFTPFHQICVDGTPDMLKLTLRITELRDLLWTKEYKHLLQKDLQAPKSPFMLKNQVLENQTRENCSPFLLTAKFDNIKIFNELMKLGCDLYTTDIRMQNALHYAVINKNKGFIE